MRHAYVVLILAVVIFAAGCTNYYAVKDPGTGKVYYTNEVKSSGGSVKFEDVKTKAQVSLQSSEVRKISKDEFNVGCFSEGKK